MCSSVKVLDDINKVFVIPNLFRNLFDCGFNVSMLLEKMLNQVQHDSLRNNLPLSLRRKGQTAPIGEVPEGQRGVILLFSLQDRAMEVVNIPSRQEHIIPCPLRGNDLRAEDESDSDIRLSRAGQDRAREGVNVW